MKKLLLIFSAAFLLASCEKGKIEKTVSSDSDSTEAWKPVDSATAMKAFMDYATVGEMHKMLAKYDGNWSGETTMWMSEDAPPMKNTMECTNKMIYGGRYQISEFKGNMMGAPFEGMSQTGYDNAKKKFVSNWIDNMGTGMMYAEGEWNASKKLIEFKGKMADVTRPGKTCAVREIFTFVDDNTQLLEMFGPGPKTGKEMKTMEIKFTRK